MINRPAILIGVVCSWLSIAALPLTAQTEATPGTRLTGSPARVVGVTENYGDISISIIPPTPGESTHGYREYLATLINRGGAPRRVELRMPADSSGARGDHIQSIRCEKDVGPGATVRMSLFQPDKPVIGGYGGGGAEVRIDGYKQQNPILVTLENRHRLSYGARMGYPTTVRVTPLAPGMAARTPSKYVPSAGFETNYVLRSRGVPTEFVHKMHTLSGSAYVIREENFPMHPLPASEWSPHWIGYSRFDGIIIMGDEIRQMSDAARTALWQYVETGGSLTILGSASVPDSWKSKDSAGVGQNVYYPGFGRCLVSDVRDSSEWSDKARYDQIESWTQTAAPWKAPRSAGQANQEFPVVEDSGVPVRGLFLLMVGFVAVIGPLNLLFLNRKKRRIWLLWTVPLISLITCATVFGYMLVSEGWNAHARTDLITLLDEKARRATTIGWAGFYSPLTPSGGLHYSQDTEVCAQVQDNHWYGNSGGTARNLDWTNDQHLTNGWVTARTPSQFMVRKSEPRRERVDITRSASGGLSMVNGLGANISNFVYADSDGQVYTAGPVPAGGTSQLKPTDRLPGNPPHPASLRLLYSSGNVNTAYAEVESVMMGRDWLGCMRLISNTPKMLLQPGRYVAVLDSAPFLDEGLKAKYRNDRSIVVGIHKEAGDES